MYGKLSFFPFYPKDFCSDPKVEAMTTLQVGAYMLLLCKAWEENPVGTLPCDDTVLARYARMRPKEWLKNKDAVLQAFFQEGGRWHQKRMVAEYAKAQNTHLHKSEAGKKGNEVRWHSDRCAIARASDSNSDSDSSSEKKEVQEKEKPKRKPRPATAQECIDFCLSRGLTHNDGAALWEHWVGNGFTNDRRAMANWQAVASNWKRRGFFFPSLQPQPKR